MFICLLVCLFVSLYVSLHVVGFTFTGCKGWFPLRKISMGSDRIGKTLNPRMGLRYQFSVPVWTYGPMIKSWSIFNFFGWKGVWIIQDGKECSPNRSDAYYPEWKPALTWTGAYSIDEVCSFLCQNRTVTPKIAAAFALLYHSRFQRQTRRLNCAVSNAPFQT